MPTQYSPIDESSFTDTAFDAEAMLHDTYHGQNQTTYANPQTPYAQPANPGYNQGMNTQETNGQQQAPQQTVNEATETRQTRSGENSALRKAINLIRDSRTVMFLGLVLVVVAGYSLIVTISYFANIGTDQSAMLNSDFDPSMIKNAGGPVGAWMAHTLLYNWLGIGSFFLIYYTAVCGLSMLKVYRPPFWNLTMRCLLTAVALSIICGLATYEFASPIYWGGRHGHLLNERLIILSGFWGALGVSIVMSGLVIFLYFYELKQVYATAATGIGAYRARQAQRREQREAQRLAEEAQRQAQEAQRQAEEAQKQAQRQAEEAEQRARAEAEAARLEDIRKAEETATETTPSYAVCQTEQTELSLAETIAERPQEPEADDSLIMPLFKSEDIEPQDETDNEPAPSMSLFNDSQSKEETAAVVRQTPTADEVLASEPYDPRADLSNFKFPPVDLLRPAKDNGPSVDIQEMELNKRRLTETLRTFGVEISKIEATIGPTVTLFEITPAEGVRTRSIKSLGEDLQLQLAAEGVRIIAPIPSKSAIGIEVPNKDPQVVSMRSVLDSEIYRNSKMELPMALGKTISNEIFMADLAKMPHLLVAGATGMGKSVGLNAIITSLLYKKHPSELKFVLIDPKRVELSLYRELERHYLASLPGEEAIITDMSKVVTVLNSLCIEMDNRLSLLEQAGARNIREYNDKFIARKLNPEKHRFLPYIVLIIDEFADLIIRQGKEIENPVSRLAAVARAAGIHLIIATQRPTVNVITGGIKLNIPGRIAFRVIQGNDSRTILDQLGANQLIGRGDMLFSINGKLERVQCAFIDTPEVSAICEYIGSQVGYSSTYELPEYTPEGEPGSIASIGDRDPLFEECARLVVQSDNASTSSLQRRYSIGYNRAGKIMDQMEAAGIVGPSQGGKPRQVLVDSVTLEHILANN